MLAVLRIERLPLVRVDGPHDPLVTHPTPLYVRPTADACAECVCIDPTPVVMRVELDGVVHTMVTGTLLKRDKAPADANWRTVELPAETTCADGKLPRVAVVYGRCEASMRWLDGVYRRYVDRYPFKRPLAIKSVAGSGKTTTLLKLAARFKAQRETDDALRGKRILYIAFNKQLVEELRGKLHAHGLTGVLTPLTFDALVKRTAEARFEAEGRPFHLVGALTPTTLTEANPWFQGKPYAMKKGLINQFAQFCQHPTATHPRELFPNKSMLAKLWEDTLQGTFLTFDGLRKRAHQEHWMCDVLDGQYARVFVDEAQDFDPIMLDILLTDTRAPKVFVGDPKQQIYEWRGTINAFERLPPDTLTLEFYTTFRMGEPATSEVATLTKTPMISGVPDRDTRLTTAVTHGTMPADTPYTYLFRSWRGLLTTAQTLGASLPPGAKLWVHDFDRQMRLMESLHERLTRPGRRQTGSANVCPEDDDLPAFLMKLTHEELAALKDAIQQRRAPSKAAAHVQMYTIHAYKGLEAEVVRVAGDVDRESEPNLHYVALTRGTDHVFVDALDEATQAKADQRARSGGGVTQWGEVQTTQTVSAKGGGGGRGDGGAPRSKPPPLAEQLRALPAETRAVAEALAALRKTRAAETGKPPYTVFPNRVLLALATTRPVDVVGLRAIHGVGDKLVASVGAEVLGIVKRAQEAQSQAPSTSDEVHAALQVSLVEKPYTYCSLLKNGAPCVTFSVVGHTITVRPRKWKRGRWCATDGVAVVVEGARVTNIFATGKKTLYAESCAHSLDTVASFLNISVQTMEDDFRNTTQECIHGCLTSIDEHLVSKSQPMDTSGCIQPQPVSKPDLGDTVLTPTQAALVRRLMVFRESQATQYGRQHAFIMTDALLLEIATKHPTTIVALLDIRGLSRTRLELYGDELLDVLKTMPTVSRDDDAKPAQGTLMYRDAKTQHEAALHQSLGLTRDMASQLDAYNVAHKYERPIVPRIARQPHTLGCSVCKELDGFVIGSLFFTGRRTAEEAYIKYCLTCFSKILSGEKDICVPHLDTEVSTVDRVRLSATHNALELNTVLLESIVEDGLLATLHSNAPNGSDDCATPPGTPPNEEAATQYPHVYNILEIS